ncbi:MAG: OmpA family protein [Treponema sp.]|nr:OmpA family protein [Treponema sp.]
MKKFFVFLTFILGCGLLFCQNLITYTGSENYILVERSDLSRKDNGKYVGLFSREIRSFISPVMKNGVNVYEGDFYVDQDTKRSSSLVGKSLHDSISSIFTIDSDGTFTMIEDNGFPSFRSFPVYSKSKITKGSVWESQSERAVDPLNKGIFTRIPMYVQYSYTRDADYHGIPVYVFKAKWATRYGNSNIDLNGDSELKSASGSHEADVFVSMKSGAAVYIRDKVDETFVYKDGNSYNFRGTLNLFTEYPPQINEEELMPLIQRVVKDDSKTDTKKDSEVKSDRLEVEKTNAGLRLRMNDLKFKPDSSELLDSEKSRFDQIVEILKKVPDSMFLVEGHTASTGREKGEMQLSLERSHSIVSELIKRGIAAERFICKGSGGKIPIADNSSEEGRAKNRRVEITILQ